MPATAICGKCLGNRRHFLINPSIHRPSIGLCAVLDRLQSTSLAIQQVILRNPQFFAGSIIQGDAIDDAPFSPLASAGEGEEESRGNAVVVVNRINGHWDMPARWRPNHPVVKVI